MQGVNNARSPQIRVVSGSTISQRLPALFMARPEQLHRWIVSLLGQVLNIVFPIAGQKLGGNFRVKRSPTLPLGV
jgi:hypothetical protein